jgi:hypothetical protein
LLRIGCLVLCVGQQALGLSSYGEAAEWSMLPSIGVKGVYNDNLLLTPLPHHETYGYWISPTVEFAGKTERLEVSGRVAADFVSDYGGEETNFTNIHFPLTMSYRTENDVVGFTGGFRRDNTLLSELLTTGFVLRFTQRNQWTANPSWTRALTEKLSFQASLQFSDTTYENAVRLGLVDYQLIGGSGGLQYQLTEKDQIQLTGSYANFYTINAPTPFRASFPGAVLTVTHAFNESSMGSLYGGPRYVMATTQTAGSNIKTQDTVWIFGASFTKKFESGSIQATVSRDIVPSGFGILFQTDRAALTITRNLSETLTASFEGAGYLVTGATRNALGGAFPENRYFYLTPKVSWKIFEWWKLELSYTYGWRDVDGFVEPAMSNATMFTVTYYPPKLALSN